MIPQLAHSKYFACKLLRINILQTPYPSKQLKQNNFRTKYPEGEGGGVSRHKRYATMERCLKK
jgi:hypothetical protein